MERLRKAFWVVERDFLGRLSVLVLGFRLAGVIQCEWWKCLAPLLLMYAVEVARSETNQDGTCRDA